MFGKKSFSNPKMFEQISCFKFNQKSLNKKCWFAKKIVSQKVLQEFQNTSRGCLEIKTSQEKSCKCLTKILALNIKCCKKSLASKPKGLLKSVAFNPN